MGFFELLKRTLKTVLNPLVLAQAWLAKVELLHKDQDKLRIQLGREYAADVAEQKLKDALTERGEFHPKVVLKSPH